MLRQPPLRQRAMRHQHHRTAGEVAAHHRLLQQHVVLDLVAGQRNADLLHHRAHHAHREIAHADGARAARFAKALQRFEDGGQVHVRRRPVHHEQVDVVQTELTQAGIERAVDRIRRQLVVPDLGGDMQRRARQR